MGKKIEVTYLGWRITRHQGHLKATCGTGNAKRRVKLDLPSSPSERDIRAALIKYVTEHEMRTMRESLTVGTAFERYVKQKERQQQVSAGKSRAYWKALEPWFCDLSPLDVNDDLCMNYAEMRQLAGKAPATIWSELTEVQLALNYARDQRWISETVRVWRPSKGKGRQRVADVNEVLAMLKAVDMQNASHMATVILVALLTSARKAAILGLTWDRVDFGRDTIRFTEDDVEAWSVVKKGYEKGRAEVPMGAFLKRHLLGVRQQSVSNHVVEYAGEPIRDCTRAMASLCERAGVQGITLHTLRHTAATWADQANIDPRDTAQLLGHANERITKQVYIHRDVEPLRPVVNLLEAHLRGKTG